MTYLAGTESGRLWSLWDVMNHCAVGALATCVGQIAIYEIVFAQCVQNGMPVADDNIRQFLVQLQVAVPALDAGGMSHGAEFVRKIHNYIVGTGDVNANTLNVEARHVRERITQELSERKFLRVASDRRGHVDADSLFGLEVTAAFPKAAGDIKEAGNCLAAECPTAAVFHLMRASEVALRILAADRGVTYPNASLESKQVGDLLSALDAKVRDLRKADAKNWPSVEVRDGQIKFYAEAVLQFRGFNEAWRRHMAHAHEGATYNREYAKGICDHVKALMVVLATKLSEIASTSEYWPSA